VKAKPVVRSTSAKSLSVSGPRKKLAPTMKATAEPPIQSTSGSSTEMVTCITRADCVSPACAP
jgi:hypothetical protein